MQPIPPPPMAPGAPVPAGPKTMSTTAKVLIGCGVVAVLGAIAIAVMLAVGVSFLKKKIGDNPTLAAAELIVRANPDYEFVESDSEKGTLTIKEKKTGEVVTMNADDIQNGKLTFTTKEGTTTFDASQSGEGGTVKMTNEKGEEATFSAGQGAPKDLPSWVPTYPGADVQGSYDATTAENRSAMFTVSTPDALEKVAEHFESQLKAAGLTVQKNSYEAAGQKTIMLVGNTSDEKRTATVTVTNAEGKTQALVNFVEKN